MSGKVQKKNKPVGQVATIEEQETIVRIDYEGKEVVVYSCRATVINRMDKLGYEPVEIHEYRGKVYSKTYKFPISMIGKFLRTSIFQYSVKED